MSWVEVKKINSDLTKPLDTFIKEYLQEHTRYVGFADVKVASANRTKITSSETTILQNTMTYPGTLICRFAKESNNTCRAYIYVNGSNVLSLSASSDNSYSSGSFSFEKGDVVKINAYSVGSATSYAVAELCGIAVLGDF